MSSPPGGRRGYQNSRASPMMAGHSVHRCGLCLLRHRLILRGHPSVLPPVRGLRRCRQLGGAWLSCCFGKVARPNEAPVDAYAATTSP